MKTEFVPRWRNRRESLLEFLLRRTAYRRMLRGYANAAHMLTGTFSTIYIVPCTARSPIVCHTNLTCHRFQLLSGGFSCKLVLAGVASAGASWAVGFC